MSEEGAFHACEVDLEFADGTHRFRLTTRGIAELQELCQAGIGTIYRRVVSGEYFDADVKETVRLALVGGGMEGPEARKLMNRYCDRWPIERWHRLSMAILVTAMHGYTPPGEGSDTDGDSPKDRPPGEAFGAEPIGSTSPGA